MRQGRKDLFAKSGVLEWNYGANDLEDRQGIVQMDLEVSLLRGKKFGNILHVLRRIIFLFFYDVTNLLRNVIKKRIDPNLVI